jgi:hypothetical protein
MNPSSIDDRVQYSEADDSRTTAECYCLRRDGRLWKDEPTRFITKNCPVAPCDDDPSPYRPSTTTTA